MFLRSRVVRFSSVPLLGIVVCFARNAHADVSTWLTMAGGADVTEGYRLERPVPALRLGTGMGTDPSHPWVAGGILRVDTMFGRGTDLSLLLRLATHGFANGDWGFALDAGPLARFWGKDAFGAAAVATLGGPWGLELGLNASFGEEHVQSLGGFIGIDLVRLTVYRRSGVSWWKNSFPAYRKPEEEQH